jgi:ABC-type lipoprotein export system ATPase subunit
MNISQLILQNVNSFKYFNHIFEEGETKRVPNLLMIMGPNGSGKTTILKSIANLWNLLGRFLENQSAVLRTWEPTFLSHSNFAAMAIKELLPDKPETIWIYQGEEEEVERFVRLYRDDHRIGFVRQKGVSLQRFRSLYLAPGEMDLTVAQRSGGLLSDLRERFVQNRLANRSDLPNMILLESERRDLFQRQEDYWFVPEIEKFKWLAQYSPTKQREGSIENYLFTLKIVNQEKYEKILAQVNQLLSDKKISGFDEGTGLLLVTTKLKQTHPVYLLSSGEKQFLLIIAFIMREMRVGGVILIDEPDLHLDQPLVQNFVVHLKELISEYKGQLIIASHILEMKKLLSDVQQVDLGRIGKELNDE